MKSKLIAILTAAIFISGFGTAYAGTFTGDTTDGTFDIEVQAEVIGAEVTVAKNVDPLNFGDIFPLTGASATTVYAAIDLGTYDADNTSVVPTNEPNPATALARATNAVVSDDNTDSADFTSGKANVTDGDVLIGGTPTPGGFVLTTNYASNVEITIDDTTTLTRQTDDGYGGFPTMELTNIRECSNVAGDGSSVTVDAGVFVWIGGVLQIEANQAAGTYDTLTNADNINVSLAFE